MIVPQYFWQVSEKRGAPIVDIPEEEFDQRLEEMIEYLESPPQIEVVPQPV
jgi:hypothetical protein